MPASPENTILPQASFMKKIFVTTPCWLFVGFFYSVLLFAETATFEIEGLLTQASPKTLTAALVSQLKVKVVALKIKDTRNGWPTLTLEYDSKVVSQETIEATIATIEDPAGHKYRVHKGTRHRAPLTQEEAQAMALLGEEALPIPPLQNPIEPSAESLARGKAVYVQSCATCHGLSGHGKGPSAIGIAGTPRPLYVWSNADASVDSYLFAAISYGRGDMPAWEVVLSAEERWHLVNYIKTLKMPANP